jgi:hypothetical protein
LLLPIGGQRREGSHVVKPVAEFDEKDADILRHADDHLAEILGLLFLMAPEGDLPDFGHPIDEARHHRAEIAFDLLARAGGIFQYVVQQTGNNRRQIHPKLCQNLGDAQRMNQVRLTRFSPLPGVGTRRQRKGLLDDGQIGRRGIGTDLRDQSLQRNPVPFRRQRRKHRRLYELMIF